MCVRAKRLQREAVGELEVWDGRGVVRMPMRYPSSAKVTEDGGERQQCGHENTR